jgi:DNA repair exonuclease SbcCD ATPase subunit
LQALKEVNESIRKRNEQGTTKEKELEGQLANLKEHHAILLKREETTQKQLKTELEGVKATLKAKEDQARVLEHNLKSAKLDSSSVEKVFRERESALSQKLKELQMSLDKERRSSASEVDRLSKLS